MDFRLKKNRCCWSRKLYSSLNVTLTHFHCQSMKLDILRRNQVFFVNFLRLINGSNLGWCFAFCLWTHIIWNCIYVTLTQSFYTWQRAVGEFFWYRNISSVFRVTFPGQFLPVKPKWCNGWNQGEQEENVSCPFFWCGHGINHCSISLYHQIIKSS